MYEPEIPLEPTTGRSSCTFGAVWTSVQWPQLRLLSLEIICWNKSTKAFKRAPLALVQLIQALPLCSSSGVSIYVNTKITRKGFQTPLWEALVESPWLCPWQYGRSRFLPVARWRALVFQLSALALALWASRSRLSFPPWGVSWLSCLSCSSDLVFLLP